MKKLVLILTCIGITLNSLSQSYLEDFETNQIANSNSFISNGKTFNLGDGWTVQNVSSFGVNATDWYIDNFVNCPNTGLVGSINTNDGNEIYLNSAWFYLSNDCNFNNEGSIIVYWFKDGLEVHNETYSINPINDIISSGFGKIDFDLDGNSCIAADEFRFEITGDLNYLGIDNFTWSDNMILSSIDSIETDKNNVCPYTNTTLTSINTIVGTGASLNWYDQANGNGTNLGSTTSINVTPSESKTFYAQLKGICNTVESSIEINVNSIDTTVTLNVDTLITQTNLTATYQWLDCNNGNSPILNATNSTYTPISAGNYSVEFSYNTCKDTSGCHTLDYVLTNEDNNIENRTHLYPNPAQKEFYLTGNTSNIRIINQIGIEQDFLLTKQIGDRQKIRVEKLPSGVYFINFNEGNSNKTLRLTIE